MKQQFQQDLEAVKKQVTDAAKGMRAASIVNKKMQQSLDETEKKEEGKWFIIWSSYYVGIPNAEFLKVQDLVRDHDRRLDQMEKKYLETEAKTNMSLERIERVDLQTKE